MRWPYLIYAGLWFRHRDLCKHLGMKPFPVVLDFADYILAQKFVEPDMIPYWGPPLPPIMPTSSPHIPSTSFDQPPARPAATTKKATVYVAVPARTTPSNRKVSVLGVTSKGKEKLISTSKFVGDDSSGIDSSDEEDADNDDDTPIVVKKSRAAVEIPGDEEDDDSDLPEDLNIRSPPTKRVQKSTMKWCIGSLKKRHPSKRKVRFLLDGNDGSSKRRWVAEWASKNCSKGLDLSHLKIDEDLSIDLDLVPRVCGKVGCRL